MFLNIYTLSVDVYVFFNNIKGNYSKKCPPLTRTIKLSGLCGLIPVETRNL